MENFLSQWGEAAYTSLGFFWMAFWAFNLGYLISSLIQVFITPAGMQKAMGQNEGKGVLLGSFFGFISSSCSFAALAGTKALLKKGASFPAAMAYLLASTNLVIELGIVISIFLGSAFLWGEYIGGLLLILTAWLLIRIIQPRSLLQKVRDRLGQEDQDEEKQPNLRQRFKQKENWLKVSRQFKMEWQMVWKDVTIGFTIAGLVAIFVPDAFFTTLFINLDTEGGPGFFSILQHVIIGPIAAFMTFIGSMGNIPLAALLFDRGVSFAGVMAFIFSDLVVFPVLRINARYYGWRMSFFILLLLFLSLIITTLCLHYGFEALNFLPEASKGTSITERDHFQVDYTLFLNLGFFLLGVILFYGAFGPARNLKHHHQMANKGRLTETVLFYLALLSYVWLGLGLLWKFF